MKDFGGFWEASWPQDGSQNQQKTTSKNNANLDAFSMRLGSGLAGGFLRRASVAQRSWDPLIDHFKKKTTKAAKAEKQSRRRTPRHAVAQKRGGGYIYIYMGNIRG